MIMALKLPVPLLKRIVLKLIAKMIADSAKTVNKIIAKPNFAQRLYCWVSRYLSAEMSTLIVCCTGIKFRDVFNTANQHFIAQAERIAYFQILPRRY